jgi:hypothetical protein
MILRCNTDSGLRVSGGFLSFLIHDDWTFFITGFWHQKRGASQWCIFFLVHLFSFTSLAGPLALAALEKMHCDRDGRRERAFCAWACLAILGCARGRPSGFRIIRDMRGWSVGCELEEEEGDTRRLVYI